MRGPLGGALETGESAYEILAPELVSSLAGAPRDASIENANANANANVNVNVGAGDVVWLGLAADPDHPERVVYNRTFVSWTPLLSAGARPTLTDFATLARALAHFHAKTRPGMNAVHGELQPAFIGWMTTVERPAPSLTLLLGPEGAPGSHLCARILHGAESLTAIAYLAPEIANGGAASAAADVYALAAMIFEVSSGMRPLGQLDGGNPRDPLLYAIRQALSDQPSRRPTAMQLAEILEKAAAPLHQPDIAAPSPAQRAALQAGRAQMSSILIVLLIVGGAFVFFGACWLVTVNWSALGEIGHFVLLALLTYGATGGGLVLERRKYAGTGLTLILLGSRLLWADAAYILDISKIDGPTPWTIAASLVTLGSFALLLWRRQTVVAWMAMIDFAITAGCLCDALSNNGGPVGLAMYGAAVASVLVLVAAALHRVPAKDGFSLGVPFACLAVLCAWISAAAALLLLDGSTHVVFAAVWPYVVAAVAAAFWWLLRGKDSLYKWCAASVALIVVSFVPSIESVARLESPIYLAATVGIGFVLLAAMIRLTTNDSRDTALTLAGLINVSACSTGTMLYRCSDLSLADCLTGPHRLEMSVWFFAAAGLLVLGVLASAREVRKPTYQLIEGVGLLQFFGALTLLSLFRTHEVGYPAVILASGALLLGLGVASRRTTWVIAAAVALLANLWFQYFLRLNQLLPTALLVIGFGVGLLALGFAYERRIKQFLPLMRAWK